MATLRSKIKKNIKNALRACFAPKIRAANIQQSLEALGVPKDNPVLVHSSLSSLGYVAGGPQTLLDGIIAHLGSQGTIVLPTHSWNLMNQGARIFDARETPSCVGALTEWFRKQPHALRSLHPTHSVAAIGPRAEEITQHHEDASTPCGQGTPYHRLLEQDATLLFLGAPLDSNTSYHCCEALAGVPYLMQTETCGFKLIDRHGKVHERRLALHQGGIARNLAGLNQALTQLNILKTTIVGKAPIRAIRGKPFMDHLFNALTQQPNCLLKENQG